MSGALNSIISARQPARDQTGQFAYALEGRQEQLAAVWSRVRPMKSAS